MNPEEDPIEEPTPAPGLPPRPDAATRQLVVGRSQAGALAQAKTMAEIVEVQREALEGLSTIGMFIQKSGLFPATINTAEKGAIIAMTAFELGLTIAQAARFIDVIDGRPFIRAKMKMALVNSRGPGRIEIVSRRSDHVTARGTRPGYRTVEVTYRLTDAERAGLLSKAAWQKDPIDMMTARATAKLADILWPEVGAGLPPGDEEGAEADLTVDVDDVRILEGEFSEVVTDPVDDDTRAAADAMLDSHKPRNESHAPRPSHASNRPAAPAPAAMEKYNDLTARMQKMTPPLRLRDVAAVIFPDQANAAVGAADLDRWLFENPDETVESLCATAARKRDR